MSLGELPDTPEPLERRLLRPRTKLHLDSVDLRTVTPVLGGAARARQVDKLDFLRVPTLRGHLRFWWRALYALQCKDARELHRRERELWGGMGSGGSEPVRSQVELRVSLREQPDPEKMLDRDNPTKKPGAYALWPARAEKKNGDSTAERWKPGLKLRLEWQVPEQIEDHRNAREEVEAAIRAWILFGGYGSRTRRGCGSLTVEGDTARWLPAGGSEIESNIEKLFSRVDLHLRQAKRESMSTPSLHGAWLHVGSSTRDGEAAWYKALGWLRDFRQGEQPAGVPPKQFARMSGQNGRPGRSNWPEPDKIRRLAGAPWTPGHEPRYGEQPAWPRAGFGLPIQVRFQQKSRSGASYQPPEPGRDSGFMLLWSDGRKPEPYDRLASPLIVKALPLAGGGFAPMALWLHRQLPKDGQVLLRDQSSGRRVPRSEAPFERMLGEGDEALYEPLRQPDLRTAFFHWLRGRK